MAAGEGNLDPSVAAWSPNGERLVALTTEGVTEEVDGRLVRVGEGEGIEPIPSALGWIDDNHVVVGVDHGLSVIDMDDGTVSARLEPSEEIEFTFDSHLAVSEDGGSILGTGVGRHEDWRFNDVFVIRLSDGRVTWITRTPDVDESAATFMSPTEIAIVRGTRAERPADSRAAVALLRIDGRYEVLGQTELTTGFATWIDRLSASDSCLVASGAPAGEPYDTFTTWRIDQEAGPQTILTGPYRWVGFTAGHLVGARIAGFGEANDIVEIGASGCA